MEGTFGGMGYILAHVLENKKSGRLSFRRAHPPELYLPIPAGKSVPVELKRSLKSTRLNDPIAIQLFNNASAEWEANVALARKKATASFDRLDNPTIEYFTALFAQQWYEDEAALLAAQEPGAADNALAGWEEKPSDFILWRGKNEVDLIEEEWARRAESFLESARFVRDLE